MELRGITRQHESSGTAVNTPDSANALELGSVQNFSAAKTMLKCVQLPREFLRVL